MELIINICSLVGTSGLILFFVKRYFDKKDKQDAAGREKREKQEAQLNVALETIRLLAYARMSEEIERLLTKGYATPSERKILDEMYHNYKAHGWNGDMDERLHKVYAMRTDHR